MIQTWRIDTPTQTLVLGAEQHRLACVVYWGSPLPATEDLEMLYHAAKCDVTGGMLDQNPELSICPEATQNLKLNTKNRNNHIFYF